jgi:hypothetical protein
MFGQLGTSLKVNQVRIFKYLLITLLGLLTMLMIWKIADGEYFLKHEDEAIYYGCAKLFHSTNSVQAAGCNVEDVSPIGRINWYGPGFHVIYGGLFKIFGPSAAAFPWFHFALALLSIAMIMKMPVAMELRITFALALALTQQYLTYIFTFFPETLVLFFATILTILLYYQSTTENEKNKRIASSLYILFCFIFSLCRITFIFWLIGWVVLAPSKKSMVVRFLLFIVTMVGTLFYMKYFLAPTYAPSLQKVDLLYQGHVIDFTLMVLDAVLKNFLLVINSGSIPLYVLLGLLISAVCAMVLKGGKFVTSAVIICLTLLLTFFALYVVSSFFFVKQTAMMIPLLLFSIILGFRSVVISYILVGVLLVIFPSRVIQALKLIKERRKEYSHRMDYRDLENAFAEIPNHIQKESSVILWCYNEYEFGLSAESLLTFSTVAGEPILYTTSVPEPDAPAEVKFQLYNKLPIDYVLSRFPLDGQNLTVVHTTKYYYLYKLKPPT